jgi:hypothetical protein
VGGLCRYNRYRHWGFAYAPLRELGVSAHLVLQIRSTEYTSTILQTERKDDKRRLPSSQNLFTNPFTLACMSESLNPRKRQRTDQDPLHQTKTTPSKRQKHSEFPLSHLPPAYWDNLSKIWLTKRALRELDRRNGQFSERSLSLQTCRPVTRNFLATIGPLARDGGPDISDLRGVRTL